MHCFYLDIVFSFEYLLEFRDEVCQYRFRERSYDKRACTCIYLRIYKLYVSGSIIFQGSCYGYIYFSDKGYFGIIGEIGGYLEGVVFCRNCTFLRSYGWAGLEYSDSKVV